jgi:histidinol-phosphatase
VNADLAFAQALADAADAVTLRYFRSLELSVKTKPDRSPVTEADTQTERVLRELIARERSGEGAFGEEFGDEGGATRWILDPIDGTRNYLRGLPVWATLIALERDGRVEVGFISAPALGRRWWAARGEGAWADGVSCRVSAVARIEDATISTTSARDMPAGWGALDARAWTSRAFGDFWQYCLLAEGGLDLATDATLQAWDYAAVALLVEEAGGSSSTFAGGPPAPGASFLASNGVLHAEAVALLRAEAFPATAPRG